MEDNVAAMPSVRAVYEDGEITFAEPVDIEGCWRVEVRFLEREKEMTFESSTHRPEMRPVPDRLEEMHRKAENDRPHTGPYGPY